jgi:Asp-tRNA(Asn)/Glu-tRNA(Gln) amidotransferase A subunit family amidase
LAIADLTDAIAAAGGDPKRAAALARKAAAAVRGNDKDRHAFIAVLDDGAIAEPPAGPLLGCVYAVKDNIDMAGLATTAGSRLLENNRASADAWVVNAMRGAGAVCIGKNNMHELALGASGVNPRFGTTTTPWDGMRTAGGSSGGSAVAVASGQVHVSFGTDSGGSVRIPAAMCGIVGYKPTAGALPVTGIAGAALTMDSLGIFARHMDGVRRVWDAIGPRDDTIVPSRPRLAYIQDDSMGRVSPPVWARYQEALEVLRRSGADLTGISMPGLKVSPYVCISVVYAEIASLHCDLMRAHPELYSPDILALFYLGALWSSDHYVDAQRLRTVLRNRLHALIQPYDAILTPTVAIQPPRIGEAAQVEGDPPGSELYTFMRFTVTLNATGYPGISVPAGLDRDRLPVGLQVIGKPYEDTKLLGIAQQVEDVLGLMPAPPSMS